MNKLRRAVESKKWGVVLNLLQNPRNDIDEERQYALNELAHLAPEPKRYLEQLILSHSLNSIEVSKVLLTLTGTHSIYEQDKKRWETARHLCLNLKDFIQIPLDVKNTILKSAMDFGQLDVVYHLLEEPISDLDEADRASAQEARNYVIKSLIITSFNIKVRLEKLFSIRSMTSADVDHAIECINAGEFQYWEAITTLCMELEHTPKPSQEVRNFLLRRAVVDKQYDKNKLNDFIVSLISDQKAEDTMDNKMLQDTRDTRNFIIKYSIETSDNRYSSFLDKLMVYKNGLTDKEIEFALDIAKKEEKSLIIMQLNEFKLPKEEQIESRIRTLKKSLSFLEKYTLDEHNSFKEIHAQDENPQAPFLKQEDGKIFDVKEGYEDDEDFVDDEDYVNDEDYVDDEEEITAEEARELSDLVQLLNSQDLESEPEQKNYAQLLTEGETNSGIEPEELDQLFKEPSGYVQDLILDDTVETQEIYEQVIEVDSPSKEKCDEFLHVINTDFEDKYDDLPEEVEELVQDVHLNSLLENEHEHDITPVESSPLGQEFVEALEQFHLKLKCDESKIKPIRVDLDVIQNDLEKELLGFKTDPVGLVLKLEKIKAEPENAATNIMLPRNNAQECIKIIDNLLQTTEGYKNNLASEDPKLHSILDELLLTLSGEKNEASIKAYFSILNTKKPENTCTNMQIIQNNKERSTARFIAGIAAIVLTIITGIIPGLITMGVVYALTGKTTMTFFKTKSELFKDKINKIEQESQHAEGLKV